MEPELPSPESEPNNPYVSFDVPGYPDPPVSPAIAAAPRVRIWPVFLIMFASILTFLVASAVFTRC